MTAEELIKKLSKIPRDAEVILVNDDYFLSGEYKATDIGYFDDVNEVEIFTDREWRRDLDGDVWSNGRESDEA